MRNKIRHTTASDSGAAMLMLGVMMTFLLGVAAFAVDLGWLYVNASRVQRTADAAALAGVTHVPIDMAGAAESATAAASANGMPIDGDITNLAVDLVGENKLHVTVSRDVETYLLRVFGMSTVTIQRDSIAEYIHPVPMGSPFNTFGDGPASGLEFWAAVQGQYANREHGDPFLTNCALGSEENDESCETFNPTYRPEGYYLGVEVGEGVSSLDLQLYDAGFYQRESVSVETGDTALLSGSDGDVASDVNFQLYAADTTVHDPSDNPPITGCSLSIAADEDPDTYKNAWVSLCNLASPPPGLYVMRVWTSGPGGESNHYGVRAEHVGGTARVYALNDMSIFANVDAGTSVLYLAEIESIHAGKILEVSFFDAGDSAGEASLTIVRPDGAAADCSWRAFDDIAGTDTASGSGECTIQTTSASGERYFNGQWVIAKVEIPGDYTCDSDCWWRVAYNYSAQAHDRTTWSARVVGNPIRLVVGDS